jgi:hypothetical protein
MNTGAGTSTLRTGNYIVTRMFGQYRVSHKRTGEFIAQAPTMRKARNIIRNVLAGKAPTTEGRE